MAQVTELLQAVASLPPLFPASPPSRRSQSMGVQSSSRFEVVCFYSWYMVWEHLTHILREPPVVHLRQAQGSCVHRCMRIPHAARYEASRLHSIEVVTLQYSPKVWGTCIIVQRFWCSSTTVLRYSVSVYLVYWSCAVTRYHQSFLQKFSDEPGKSEKTGERQPWSNRKQLQWTLCPPLAHPVSRYRDPIQCNVCGQAGTEEAKPVPAASCVEEKSPCRSSFSSPDQNDLFLRKGMQCRK